MSGCSVCYCPVAKTLISAIGCTSAIGSSSYMGLISASSACGSFPDLLLVSFSFDSVPLLSMSTKLASNALHVSTFPSVIPCVASLSNMYDMLLQECVSNDVMCSYLHSLSDLDAHTELQCLYVHKLKECECLAQKLYKQTETVKQMKNDTVCKEKASNVFLKEREQYFEIQDLKAQLQDKNIAISELKKLIEKMKGKSVDTNFEKQSILGEIAFATNQKSTSGSNDMVHNYYLEKAKKKAQLQKDKALNTKPSMHQSARLPNTSNGYKPKPRNSNQQPRNWPPSMSSRVSNRSDNTAEPPRIQKPLLKSKDLACPTCKKCIYSANHDECILQYLSKVNSHASVQKMGAQSHKTTKRYIPIEKKSDSKNHGRQIPIGQPFSPNKSSNVYLKTTALRSGLTWKPTGRIFTQVGLRWIPIRKPVETRYNTNDSASPLGKKTHNPNTTMCANSSSLSAGTSMASEPISLQGSSNVNWINFRSTFFNDSRLLYEMEGASPHLRVND
ncbi:hypothetical protein Tco_1268000 [Tanacetum coccineum]